MIFIPKMVISTLLILHTTPPLGGFLNYSRSYDESEDESQVLYSIYQSSTRQENLETSLTDIKHQLLKEQKIIRSIWLGRRMS